MIGNNGSGSGKKTTLVVDNLNQSQFFDFPPTLWFKYSFAQDWFEDALNEARFGKGRHSLRREIIFAVAFAESYLVEWVRDEILKGDFEKLRQIFSNKKISAEDKWKKVPNDLVREGLLEKTPNLKASFWQDWKLLINYRNGLVHAVSSLPESGVMTEKEKPFPLTKDLDNLEPGWPTNVVINLVKEFHSATKTNPPSWLIEP